MSKWRCGRWLTVLAAGCVVPCLLVSTAFASQEAAKRYFQNGVELISAAEPNYQDAYYQFQLAYQESSKSWKVLGNLGLCALKLERDQEAVTYYEQYLEKGRSEIAPEERNAIEQDLMLLKGNLATVRLSSAVQNLKITDQRTGSSVPAQPYSLQGGVLELRLRAGNHSIAALSGDRRLVWEVVLEPRSEASHVFDFDAPSAVTQSASAAPGVTLSADAARAPAQDQPPAASSGLRWSGYAALGIGAVGLGVGGYFLWQGSDYSHQADKAFACDRQAGGCSPTERDAVRSLEGQSTDAKTRAAITLGLGGAAVATGVVLLVVAASSPASTPKSQAAKLVPWLGYRSAGLAGSF